MKIKPKYFIKGVLPFRSIFLLCLVVSTYTLFGQNSNLRFKYYTLEDGLSQVSSNDLLKDSNGFIWIATDDGLNRFDGKVFKHFKNKAKDTTSIKGNQITKLLEDKTGKIWIGTSGQGLNYYDKDLDVFHPVNLDHSQNKNEYISDLASDAQGNIWVASRNSGLHLLQARLNSSFSQKNYFSNQPLTALSSIKNDKLWVGDFNGSVYEFNILNQKSSPDRSILNIGSKILAFYPIDRYLFIGSETGFYIYDRNSKKNKLFELEKEGDLHIVHVTSFLKKDESSVWIGSASGLFLFDWVQMRVIRKIEYSVNGTNGLSNNTVLSLLNLTNEQLLVGTANSLNLLDFSEPYFKNISKDKNGKHLLNDNVIFSILKDGKDLWIGTSDGGLNLIRNNKTYTFKEDQKKSGSISGNVIREIVKDSKNQRLWFATSRGLSMIDLKTFDLRKPVFRVFHYEKGNPNSINMDFLKGIALDKNGNLWGATFGRGIFRLEKNGQNNVKIYRYKNEKDNLNSLVNNITQCIRVDNQNNIWVGSQGGLTKISFKDKNYNDPVFTNFKHDADRPNSLSNNSVYDILVDNNDRIWLGTRRGLNLLKDNGQFDSWSKQKQFPNDLIYSIQDDIEGNLWLGTNDGIAKYNVKESSFSHYNVQDGIQSKEFDIHARFRDKKGNIYLGGIGGLTYFNPDELQKIDKPVPVYFSQLRIKNQQISPNNSSFNFLKKTIENSKEIEIKHNQFPFYLQFSYIDFRLKSDYKYAYKLLPIDEEWNFLKDPVIQFLNLPAGKYTIQVNGFSRGKEWEQAPLEMDLHILPPWWATWWAYLTYLGIAVLFADRFYRFQLSKKLAIAESNRLKEVNHLKTSLYTNITHEFRTPLTVILGMADAAKSNIEEKQFKASKNSLEMIKRNGKNLLRLVNEMLDLSKLESGNIKLKLVQSDVVPFVKYLSESFHSLANTKKINLTVYSEIEQLLMDFDTNKLSAIISNLLSNAIKFTPQNGKVIVHLKKVSQKDKSCLFIKVKDNGLGIPKRDIDNIFNRFYRVDNYSSYQSVGTGIGLALTKEFVELMNGTISVKSIRGKGSEFIVQLPINNTSDKIKNSQIQQESDLTFSSNGDVLNQPISDSQNNPALPLALIVEDNADVAHYLKTCLTGKYQTIYAENGDIGIKKAFEYIPDVIICDVMMPVKDGIKTCEEIKSDERTDHIPIVMLTAKVTLKDKLKGLSSGADAYLTKPFEKAELLTRLDHLVLLRKKLMQKIENDSFSKFLKIRAENPETKFLQKIIKIIHEEISNHSFGSSIHISHKMHLSESQIYRKLKAITGKSTAVFIRSVRLQRAKEMILSNNKTISEIAYDVGFNDPSWFSRAFREEFGYPPSAISK